MGQSVSALTVKQDSRDPSGFDSGSETSNTLTTANRTGTGTSAWLQSEQPWPRFIRAGVWDQQSMPKAAHWGEIWNGPNGVPAVLPKRTWTREQLTKSSTPVLDLPYGDDEIPDNGTIRRTFIQDILLGLRARCGPSAVERYRDTKRRPTLLSST